MKELLYLDQQRFDRYSAQAVPALSKVEKTKELGAEFSLTGPKRRSARRSAYVLSRTSRGWTRFGMR